MTSALGQQELRDEYLRRVSELYECVKDWTTGFDPNAEFEEDTVILREEPVDPYPATVLVIKRPGYKPVRLIPRGRWIIGAEGRVDLKSDLGTEIFVYASEGGPHIRFEVLTETGKMLEEDQPKALAKDVAQGWVFVQNRQLGMLPAVDAYLFSRLLEVLGR